MRDLLGPDRTTAEPSPSSARIRKERAIPEILENPLNPQRKSDKTVVGSLERRRPCEPPRLMALRFMLRRRFATRTCASIPTLHPGDPSSCSPSATLQLLSWGRGSSGQLGDPLERDLRPYPSAFASLSIPPDSFLLSPAAGRLPSRPAPLPRVPVEVGISCGLFHSAIVVDGKVWIWGKGDGGRLGFGDEVSQFVPRLNPNLEGISSLVLGGIHSAALSRSGEVFTW